MPMLDRLGFRMNADGSAQLGAVRLTPTAGKGFNPLRSVNQAWPAIQRGIGVVVGASAGTTIMNRTGISLSSLRPGAGPAPVLPGAGEFGPETPDYCNFITNPALRAACSAASTLIGRGGGGVNVGSCPPGYERNTAGECVTTGVGRYLPGDVGAPDVVWSPVNGRYGAGYTPMAVQTQRMFCPPGYKLGKDNVCYECLKAGERKWNPGTKPFLTGGEVRAIRRARSLERRFKRLQGGKNALFPRAAAPRASKGKRK